MSVKFHNFGGVIGWNLQKRFPKLSSESYLKLQFLTRNKLQKRFIEYFLKGEEPPMPLVVNIETINRCNSTCSFCTANKNAEKRPYKKMDEKLFYKIIDQLRDWGYKGHLTLYGNNEPFWIPGSWNSINIAGSSFRKALFSFLPMACCLRWRR